MKKPPAKIYKDVKLRQGTEEWKQWRYDTGIGGSEIASVLATSSFELSQLVYTAPIKLFLQKIGDPVQAFTGNVSSHEGKFQEKAIVKRFVYYDMDRPDNMLMHHNMQNNIVMNRVFSPNCVFYNPDLPHGFYSPDSLWMKEIEPRKFARAGLLEAKLTNSMECARYKNKINPSHVFQVLWGLRITGLPVGYVLTLVDGQFFEPVPIYPNVEIFQWMEDVSADFWRKVLRARMIKIEHNLPYYFNVNPDSLTEQQKDGVEKISALEPALIGSEHEMKFIREMIIPKAEEVAREGTDEEWMLCEKYLQANENIKHADAEKVKIYEQLLMSLKGANMVNFSNAPVKGCYFSFMPDKNGRPSLKVSQKIKQL